MNQRVPPLLTLVGDEEENFYQLGVKDREKYSNTYQHLKSLTSLNNQFLDVIVQETIGLLAASIVAKDIQLSKNFKAYAEGLEISLNKFLGLMLFPEILSSLDKWIPSVNTYLSGCSSLFINDNGSPVHFRILDFPLVNSYDQNERMIHYKFKNAPQIYSYSSAGFPYPSITAMNSEGITLAIHQKFTNFFNRKGNPIFEICYKVLNEGHDLKSVLKILKRYPSLTTWGINLSFKDGTVASIDIAGEMIIKKEFNIFDQEYLYFNNLPLQHNKKQDKVVPYGMESYCDMRTIVTNEKMNKFKNKKIKTFDLIEHFTTPTISSADSARDWKLSPLTASSVTALTMNAKEGISYYTLGDAPKINMGEHLKTSNIWGAILSETIKSSAKVLNLISTKNYDHYQKGLRSLAIAQSELDKKNIHLCFHNLQLSLDFFKGLPEQFILRFFFLTLRYIYFKNSKDLGFLILEFKALENKLPSYLNEQNRLFIFRIEILLFNKSTIKETDFTYESLQKLYQFEQKLKPFSLKLLRKLIILRMDTLDILYPYFKILS